MLAPTGVRGAEEERERLARGERADREGDGLSAVAVDVRVRQHVGGERHSITFFSIGSTVTPCSRNHATAPSIASRVPSSSRAMMPMSSPTLALRMFVTTSNLRLHQ